MSFHDDVYREALHDWLDERPGLAADELPSRAELAEDGAWRCGDCGCVNADHEAFCYRCGAGQPDENVCGRCGRELLWNEGPFCVDCED
jgi:hypothetical protein